MNLAPCVESVFEIDSSEEPRLETTESGFAAMVQRQARFVFRVAYAVLRNAEDAEDVVQDVFLKIHKSGAWKNIESERAFLARAGWRAAVDRLGKRRLHSPVSDARDSEESPEERVVRADSESVVHRLIDALPEDLRQVLVLSAMDEFRSFEIARAMGIPEGTVRTRLMRARRILRDKMIALEGQRS